MCGGSVVLPFGFVLLFSFWIGFGVAVGFGFLVLLLLLGFLVDCRVVIAGFGHIVLCSCWKFYLCSYVLHFCEIFLVFDLENEKGKES